MDQLGQYQQVNNIGLGNNIDPNAEYNSRYDNVNWKHDHFICIKCGEVEDIDHTFDNDIKTINNNQVLDCDITYKGICKKCE